MDWEYNIGFSKLEIGVQEYYSKNERDWEYNILSTNNNKIQVG